MARTVIIVLLSAKERIWKQMAHTNWRYEIFEIC